MPLVSPGRIQRKQDFVSLPERKRAACSPSLLLLLFPGTLFRALAVGQEGQVQVFQHFRRLLRLVGTHPEDEGHGVIEIVGGVLPDNVIVYPLALQNGRDYHLVPGVVRRDEVYVGRGHGWIIGWEWE
jgi:hypothetical protein